MLIKDQQGKFTLRVDKGRRIVYETIVGLFSKEDYQRYHNDYITKAFPILGNAKPWAIITDLSQYKTSNISDEINKHVKWKVENNLSKASIVMDSAIIKMQMNRGAKGNAIDPTQFGSIGEAEKWLESQGF